MPFSIGPMIATSLIAVAVVAAIIGGVHLIDTIYQAGESTAQLATEKQINQSNEQAQSLADKADAAWRQGMNQGAIARLRREWCTNCKEAR